MDQSLQMQEFHDCQLMLQTCISSGEGLQWRWVSCYHIVIIHFDEVSQSQTQCKVITIAMNPKRHCRWYKARENVCKRVTIYCFFFIWWQSDTTVFKPITCNWPASKCELLLFFSFFINNYITIILQNTYVTKLTTYNTYFAE